MTGRRRITSFPFYVRLTVTAEIASAAAAETTVAAVAAKGGIHPVSEFTSEM